MASTKKLVLVIILLHLIFFFCLFCLKLLPTLCVAHWVCFMVIRKKQLRLPIFQNYNALLFLHKILKAATFL